MIYITSYWMNNIVKEKSHATLQYQSKYPNMLKHSHNLEQGNILNIH